jgi:hypothetical protein
MLGRNRASEVRCNPLAHARPSKPSRQPAHLSLTAPELLTSGSRMSVPHHTPFFLLFPFPLPLLSHAEAPSWKGMAVRSCSPSRMNPTRLDAPLHRPSHLPPPISTTLRCTTLTLAAPGNSSPFPPPVGKEEEGKEAGRPFVGAAAVRREDRWPSEEEGPPGGVAPPHSASSAPRRHILPRGRSCSASLHRRLHFSPWPPR